MARMALHRHLVISAALAAGLFAAAAAAPAADLERGAELYQLCAQCHGDDGAGNPHFLAPAIANLPTWYVEAQLRNFEQGLRGLHPEDVGGLRMYPMAQTFYRESDIPDVAAYVASLPAVQPPHTVEGDPARGQVLYTPCTACHGPQAAGNQALNAPPLTGQSDWYLVESLQKFKAGIRGNDPRNANAQIMRGMANTLADEQAMRDVVAYIQTLSGQSADATGAAAAAGGEEGE